MNCYFKVHLNLSILTNLHEGLGNIKNDLVLTQRTMWHSILQSQEWEMMGHYESNGGSREDLTEDG